MHEFYILQSKLCIVFVFPPHIIGFPMLSPPHTELSISTLFVSCEVRFTKFFTTLWLGFTDGITAAWGGLFYIYGSHAGRVVPPF